MAENDNKQQQIETEVPELLKELQLGVFRLDAKTKLSIIAAMLLTGIDMPVQEAVDQAFDIDQKVDDKLKAFKAIHAAKRDDSTLRAPRQRERRPFTPITPNYSQEQK